MWRRWRQTLFFALLSAPFSDIRSFTDTANPYATFILEKHIGMLFAEQAGSQMVLACSQDVFQMGDRLKMVGVHAHWVPAEMINL